MGQIHTVGKVATTVETDKNGTTRVTYHNTVVVEFTGKTVILRTGGWRSKTTKMRMNQASNQFSLGYEVYQRKGKWFVDTNGTTLAFDTYSIEFNR